MSVARITYLYSFVSVIIFRIKKMRNYLNSYGLYWLSLCHQLSLWWRDENSSFCWQDTLAMDRTVSSGRMRGSNCEAPIVFSSIWLFCGLQRRWEVQQSLNHFHRHRVQTAGSHHEAKYTNKHSAQWNSTTPDDNKIKQWKLWFAWLKALTMNGTSKLSCAPTNKNRSLMVWSWLNFWISFRPSSIRNWILVVGFPSSTVIHSLVISFKWFQLSSWTWKQASADSLRPSFGRQSSRWAVKVGSYPWGRVFTAGGALTAGAAPPPPPNRFPLPVKVVGIIFCCTTLSSFSTSAPTNWRSFCRCRFL